MQQRSLALSALFLIAVLAACGGGDPAARGPQPGSAAWHWEGGVENFDSGDFAKAVEHINDVAGREDPLAEPAVLWRTSTLIGLSRGYMEVVDACRAGIEEDESRDAAYQNIIQQANRDGRQFAIELAESMGEVEKIVAAGDVKLDFPFPSGSASRPNMLLAVESGDAVPSEQMPGVVEATLRRGLIRAAAELGGFDADAGNEASAKFGEGPVTVPADDFRKIMAKVLLDVSLLFSRERVNQPDVRKIFIERAEGWAAPFAESEDEDDKTWAEEFAKEVEDEQRDIERKARRLGKRK